MEGWGELRSVATMRRGDGKAILKGTPSLPPKLYSQVVPLCSATQTATVISHDGVGRTALCVSIGQPLGITSLSYLYVKLPHATEKGIRPVPYGLFVAPACFTSSDSDEDRT